MKVNLNGKEYTFLMGYQNQNKYRMAFNDLAMKVFNLSFENWYQFGYWNEKYIPYTLFDEGKAVANLSVNIMDFCVFGKLERYIQIGTVMTDEQYRNKGLSTFLMEKAVKDWEEKCDLLYLYANPSALRFYPKFGFEVVKEFECFKSIENNSSRHRIEKLNMDMQINKDKLYDYARDSIAFGKISLQENADLIMFNCSIFLKENIYYIPSLDVIVVTKMEQDKFQLLDVFGKSDAKLDEIISSLVGDTKCEILLGFTPEDSSSYTMREVIGDALFIQKGKTRIFDNNIMFPVLSHA